MKALAIAIDVLFADPNLGVEVIYRTGGAGPGTIIRAIIRQPDRISTFGETRIATATLMIDVRVSEVAAPVEGDTIERNGTIYVIQGQPIRDAEGLIWTIEARPQ